MPKLLTLLAAALLLAHGAAASAVAVTEEEFDASVSADGVTTVVKFYAPWCGHCKKLSPTWDELATAVGSETVKVVKVDCTQEKSLCQKHEVRSYPTLNAYRGGSRVAQHRGDRSLDALKGFVTRAAQA